MMSDQNDVPTGKNKPVLTDEEYRILQDEGLTLANGVPISEAIVLWLATRDYRDNPTLENQQYFEDSLRVYQSYEQKPGATAPTWERIRPVRVPDPRRLFLIRVLLILIVVVVAVILVTLFFKTKSTIIIAPSPTPTPTITTPPMPSPLPTTIPAISSPTHVTFIVPTAVPIAPSLTAMPQSPTPTPSSTRPPPIPQVEAKTGPNVNVRAGDSTAYQVVGSLAAGERAIIVGQSSSDSDWLVIRLSNGTQGFIAGWLVNKIGDTSNLVDIDPPPKPSIITVTFTPPPVPIPTDNECLATLRRIDSIRYDLQLGNNGTLQEEVLRAVIDVPEIERKRRISFTINSNPIDDEPDGDLAEDLLDADWPRDASGLRDFQIQICYEDATSLAIIDSILREQLLEIGIEISAEQSG